jgi:hypothetical protein
MKQKRKPRTIQIPLWMDAAVNDLALKHKRSMSHEIEFLVEEALKNQEVIPEYSDRQLVPMGEATV